MPTFASFQQSDPFARAKFVRLSAGSAKFRESVAESCGGAVLRLLRLAGFDPVCEEQRSSRAEVQLRVVAHVFRALDEWKSAVPGMHVGYRVVIIS